MTKGITIYTITDNAKVVVSGLTVKLVNPGDNFSSGNNIVLTEDGSSGYYENSSVTSNQEGYYEVWHDQGGPGADSGQRVNVGMLNHSGLKTDAVEDNNIKDGEIVHAKLANDAVEDNNIKDGEVVHAKLANDAVEDNNIKDGEVVHAKLANDAVETDNIKNGEVTYVKFDSTAQQHDHPTKVKMVGFDSGGRKILHVAAFGTSTAASSFNIDLNIPDNALIIGVQLRVDIALSQNWNADFNGGSSASICSDINKALNTKVNVQFHDIIVNAITDITITSQIGDFVADGQVRASVFYIIFDTMSDYGV